MLRRLVLTVYLLLCTASFYVSPAMADDEWDRMGRGGDASFTVLLIIVGLIYGAHSLLKELDRDYIYTALFGCIVYFVIAIISYNVFDYKMGWGWFITIFVGSIYIGKNSEII